MSRMDKKWRCIGLLMMALTLGLVRGQMSSLPSNTVTPQPSATTIIIEVSLTSNDMMMPEMTTEIVSMTEPASITSQIMQTTTMVPMPTLTPTPTPDVPVVMPTTTTISSEASSFSVATSPTMVAMTSPTPTIGEMQTTNPPTTTTDSPPPPPSPSEPTPDPPPTPSSSGFPEAAIYGIAAGGGALLIIAAIAILICCCCCCCSCSKSEDYVPDKPFMVVRTYDQNFAPMDRSGSLISRGSRGNSMRSSISSIASSIRSSIRRLSRKNRAVSGGEGQIAMKVTPL